MWRRGQKCWWLFCERRLATGKMEVFPVYPRYWPIYGQLIIYIYTYIYIYIHISSWSELAQICLLWSGSYWNSLRKRGSTMKLWQEDEGWEAWLGKGGLLHSWRRGKSEKSHGSNATESSAFSSYSHFFGHEEICFFFFTGLKKTSESDILPDDSACYAGWTRPASGRCSWWLGWAYSPQLLRDCVATVLVSFAQQTSRNGSHCPF